MKIKDSVAIVTGASSGIGLATAKLLSQKGAKVALVARSKDKLEKISRELPDSFVYVADMSHEDEVRKMIAAVHDHYGRIDILINNAGRGYFAGLENIDTKKYRDLFDLNIIGPLVAMQAVIPIMKKQGSGYIVNVSSGTALMFIPNLVAYSSTKRALVGISLTAREELADDHIGVSVIYPYITKTDFYKNGLGENEGWGEDRPADENRPKPDSPDLVAEKLVEGIEKETPEIFVHDWMKKGR